jgi:hypothetical protein
LTSLPAAQQPSPSPTPASSPAGPATAIPDLPITTLDFSCRLPFSWADARNNDFFLTIPSGDVSLDPNGNGGWYYDRADARWLPVGRRAVSRDEASYAFIEMGSADYVLHVVAVATGKEVLWHIPTSTFNGQPSVFDYSPDGVYVVNAFEHLLPGLWLIDPASGSIRQVSKVLYPVYSAGNGIVWVQDLNPSDPNPLVTGSSLGTLPNEIDRVDLRSGARTKWLFEPGKGLSFVGLDSSGLPLITEIGIWNVDPDGQLMLVAAPDSPRSIYKGANVIMLGDSITDAHGVWIGGQRGIYLYTNGAKLVKVSNNPSELANGCF